MLRAFFLAMSIVAASGLTACVVVPEEHHRSYYRSYDDHPHYRSYDYDRDGVPNWRDRRPYDPYRY